MTQPSESIDTLWDELIDQARIPRATYRLQFSPTFTFNDAKRLISYLKQLGISDLYASPLFKPRSGSTHGYDTVDYNTFNPALGSEEEFNQLAASLQEHDMSLLLDIVPNHMGVSTENDWWTDVLKQGPSSMYSRYFDIDWKPKNRTLDNKILLPILHSHYGEVLEEGHLSVVYWHGDFYVHYFENQFPMTPDSYIHILEDVLESLPDHLEESEAWVPIEVASVSYSLKFLPEYWLTDVESIATRNREQTIIRWRLLGLFDKSELFRNTLQASLDRINGTTGDPSSFDTLDVILSEQPYHLAYWQVASDEINYRRFFDINDMAAIRTEDLRVFADVHRLTLNLLAQGVVTGLRIDHPDGLRDPERYFWRLQSGFVDALIQHRFADRPDHGLKLAERLNNRLRALDTKTAWPLYVLGEKILSDSEPLPDTWAIHGTTGYDFMYAANNLFVDSSAEGTFNQLYTAFTDEHVDFEVLTDETKKTIMMQSLTSEIASLSTELARIVEQNRRFRGFTQNSLAFVLSEFISAMDIYRTYITGPEYVSERDRKYIEAAMARAKKNNPLMPESVFNFLEDILLMRNFDEFSETHRPELRDFVMKFQQITGPVMAKSVEDTAFYRYNRLVSLNEVGGHPDHFGSTVADFHAHNLEKQRHYPYTMLSTSTHDTKRSEDVRCRISVLSEMPDQWRETLHAWAEMNAPARSTINDKPAPSRNDEYLIYQTLLGTCDTQSDDDESFQRRVIAYMHKAVNEAKTYSNWVNPNRQYGEAISTFVEEIWSNKSFRASFDAIHRRISYFGYLNSLSQVLLKLTCPGVPDIYQGNELWNYSLVDPDNRRAIDFSRRGDILASIQKEEKADRRRMAAKLLDKPETGAIKLYLTYRLLSYREIYPDLFREGAYLPIQVGGTCARHLCAFARQIGSHRIIVVAPRLTYTLMQGKKRPPLGETSWKDTQLALPEDMDIGDLENILTGEHLPQPSTSSGRTLAVKDLLTVWPLAVLTSN